MSEISAVLPTAAVTGTAASATTATASLLDGATVKRSQSSRSLGSTMQQNSPVVTEDNLTQPLVPLPTPTTPTCSADLNLPKQQTSSSSKPAVEDPPSRKPSTTTSASSNLGVESPLTSSTANPTVTSPSGRDLITTASSSSDERPSDEPPKAQTPAAPAVMTIEELRAQLVSCYTCGVSWGHEQVSLDCRECGGYALRRPCPLCAERGERVSCTEMWQRDLTMSHACGKARWQGRCSITGVPGPLQDHPGAPGLPQITPPKKSSTSSQEEQENCEDDVSHQPTAAIKPVLHATTTTTTAAAMMAQSSNNNGGGGNNNMSLPCGAATMAAAQQQLAQDLCARLERLGASS